MQILFSKDFKKKYLKMDLKIKNQFTKKLDIFSENKEDALLNNHALKGDYQGYRSINITGDIRAIYKNIDNEIAYFVDMGNHSNLYS